ncbi:MAG TPA: DUF1778 domain-containing protein [Herpetosiphonaceae bacterium]|nr:DUF1778 domain-containing protein [Herpetosiphonaceae bacterium]
MSVPYRTIRQLRKSYDSARRRPEELIREHEVIRLSARDSLAFVEALLNPPPPSPHIRALAERYQREVVER